MSASLMLLLELEYMKTLHCVGWNSAAVMTSVISSMFAGLMSTISGFLLVVEAYTSEERRTKGLIGDIQVPEIDTEVVGRNISLQVRVDRDRMDVICVRIGVYFPRHSSNNIVLLCDTREFKL